MRPQYKDIGTDLELAYIDQCHTRGESQNDRRHIPHRQSHSKGGCLHQPGQSGGGIILQLILPRASIGNMTTNETA